MNRTVKVPAGGKSWPVTVSDENRALLDAAAAGRAAVGIWDPDDPPQGRTDGFDRCLYLVPNENDVTEPLLLRALLRHLDLPWKIGETERLVIREFAAADPLEPPSADDGDGVFSDPEKREAYRNSQYRFEECGLWALILKETGCLIGKAGITGGELGYHIYPEYRRQGFGREACLAVLSYAKSELELSTVRLRTDEANLPSQRLAEALGFHLCGQQGKQRIYERNL